MFFNSKLRLLKKNLVKCENCGAKIDLEHYSRLRFSPCPSCEAPFFSPLKVSVYWLHKPLGAGGRGSVYCGLSEKDGGEYAVKVLPRMFKNNIDFINTLKKEALISDSLGKNPHIVQTVAYGRDENEYYVVYEMINGERVDNIVEGAGRFPEKLALDVITQVVEAEQHIITCGLLYRDMKPENIMIEKNGNVRLLDYGLCTSLEEAADTSKDNEIFEGSPLFIPPERIYGKPEGEFSEIYSLGMVFYYMLTARTYYTGDGPAHLVRKHIKAIRLPSVKVKLNYCDPLTVEMLDKMIARDASARYQSFEHLKKDLKQVQQSVKKSKLPENAMSFKEFAGEFYEETSKKRFLWF